MSPLTYSKRVGSILQKASLKGHFQGPPTYTHTFAPKDKKGYKEDSPYPASPADGPAAPHSPTATSCIPLIPL